MFCVSCTWAFRGLPFKTNDVFKMAARKFQLNDTLMILVLILIFWKQFKPNTYRFEYVNTTDPAYAFMPAKSISFRYMTSLNFLMGRISLDGVGKCKQTIAITVSKQYLLLSLIVAGDISPNPGQTQTNYYCQVCEGQIIPGDVRTFCSYCQNFGYMQTVQIIGCANFVVTVHLSAIFTCSQLS